MVSVELSVEPLVRALDNVVDNLPKELRIVSWKTAKKTKSLMAKAVTKELSVTQKIVRSQLKEARHGETGATVTLKKSKRIGLRDFNARQTKTGVSYKISKTKGRKNIAGAFTGPKPGLTFVKFHGHVMKRVGKSRLPIQKLYGPSPWGVFAKNEMQVQTTPKVNNELRKQLSERVRFKTLKRSGAI